MPSRPKTDCRRERYSLDRSPFAQSLTQRKLATLLKLPLHQLKGLIKYRSAFVTEKDLEAGGKIRRLSYPTGKLRLVNEKIKFQLDKIILPEYVLSPRKGLGQRDNALHHIDAKQVLKVDLRQFYPSVTKEYIARFFRETFAMHPDVAGLISGLLTHDGKVFFGGPATPVLVALAHSEMFDEISSACEANQTKMTLWVDNLFISGEAVPGELLVRVREIIASHGYQSHDIKFEHTNRAVSVTGVNVKRRTLLPSNGSELAVRDLERQLRDAVTIEDYDRVAQTLLSRLGYQLHVVGSETVRGQKIAARMNTIRQKRNKLLRSQSG